MGRLVIDESLRSQLVKLTQPVEFYDLAGHIVGQFLPAGLLPGSGRLSPPPLPEEELRRREQEPDYSTAEVLAHLEKL